jgi:hypothetical protein
MSAVVSTASSHYAVADTDVRHPLLSTLASFSRAPAILSGARWPGAEKPSAIRTHRELAAERALHDIESERAKQSSRVHGWTDTQGVAVSYEH